MQNNLFKKQDHISRSIPLAEELRPRSLNDYVGQEKLIGKDGVIKKLIEKDNIFSMIFWGPPGVGKTTLAKIIANETKSKFIQISAVTSGKADLINVIKQAKEISQIFNNKKTILFIDEIHRFNKLQQDYLLPFVEDGTIILIGATTENPSFEVIGALLSRCRVFTLERHTKNDLETILKNAINHLQNKALIKINFEDTARNMLLDKSNGDPRTLLNALEMGVFLSSENLNDKLCTINKEILEKIFESNSILYDKNGEEHYNIISALHKSIRSSDINASLYWLARMIEGGEDPKYIARRLLRFASEDIGIADSNAVILANTVFDTCMKLGYPECNVHLAHLVIYLSKAPKDNSAYVAINKALQDARETLNLAVPLHLRNAPTKLMKDLNYGKGYIYDHNVEGKKSGQQCLPGELIGKNYYQ